MPTQKFLDINGLSHYKDKSDAELQKTVLQNSSCFPIFDDMTPLETHEFDIDDSAYHPIYTIANSNLDYTTMNISIAYRITVTGSGINQVSDVEELWHSPTVYPITTMINRTYSTSAGATGFRYLRAVYPTSSYVNDSTYPLGQEIAAYNATARHIKIEVFKNNSLVTWKDTKENSIYVDATHNGNGSITVYSYRGWVFRQPVTFTATSASSATYVASYETVTVGASVLKTGATAIAAGTISFLADDGLVYNINNTTKNMATGVQKVAVITSAINANTAISNTYFRYCYSIPAATMNVIPHDTMVLGNRLFLRCTMDASGNIHSDNYVATSMSAGYTWLPFGIATAATTAYIDTRNQHFYTLDANGKLTHIDGKEIFTPLLEEKDMVVTYQDDSTETIKLAVFK